MKRNKINKTYVKYFMILKEMKQFRLIFICFFLIEDGISTSYMKERNSRFNNEQDESIQGRMWMFDMAQREHELKLRMLNIALEKVELQKQTAINELKTSEIKRQLVENQAAEYYR